MLGERIHLHVFFVRSESFCSIVYSIPLTRLRHVLLFSADFKRVELAIVAPVAIVGLIVGACILLVSYSIVSTPHLPKRRAGTNQPHQGCCERGLWMAAPIALFTLDLICTFHTPVFPSRYCILPYYPRFSSHFLFSVFLHPQTLRLPARFFSTSLVGSLAMPADGSRLTTPVKVLQTKALCCTATTWNLIVVQ